MSFFNNIAKIASDIAQASNNGIRMLSELTGELELNSSVFRAKAAISTMERQISINNYENIYSEISDKLKLLIEYDQLLSIIGQSEPAYIVKREQLQQDIDELESKRYGEYVSRYPAGLIKCKCNLYDNKWHGTYVSYYKDGTKAFEVPFLHGAASGKAQYWYEDGQQQFRGDFKFGKFSGNSVYWYENGDQAIVTYSTNDALIYKIYLPNHIFLMQYSHKLGGNFSRFWFKARLFFSPSFWSVLLSNSSDNIIDNFNVACKQFQNCVNLENRIQD